MARWLVKLGARWRARWLRNSIDRALALNRNQVRPDGLQIAGTSFRCKISWYARDVHPWDCDLIGERKALRLLEQTLSDTEAALEGLFAALPEVDEIDMRVLEGGAGKRGTLMSGSISRGDFEKCHPASTAMRLRLIGVKYNLIGSRFEPLAHSGLEQEGPRGIGAPTQDRSEARFEEGAAHVWWHHKTGSH
jgi:hypothetical protein